MQKAKRGRPSSGPPDETLNGEPHFIETKEQGSAACDECKANKLAKRNNILLHDLVSVVHGVLNVCFFNAYYIP
jgi:hypothetical protein